MGVKASSVCHPPLEPLNSTNLFEKVNDDDSLELAFSLPCSPSPHLESELMEKKPTPNVQIQQNRPMYFFNAFNGSHILLPLFLKLNWQRTNDKLHQNCVMRWTETVLQLNYQTFKEGEQMVNHVPNCGCFTNKLGLLLSLRAYEHKVKSYNKLGLWYTMKNFVPDTYWIDDAAEKAEFNAIQKDGQIWIYKPCGMNQGKGIQLVRSRKEFRALEDERLEEIRKNPNAYRPRIIQKYLAQPLLLDGKKFDIRVYMGIASTMPYLVLFHFGYVRVSTRKYDLNDMDLITHLTNQFIQKKDPNYNKVKEDTVWTLDRFNDYINSKYIEKNRIPRDWAKNGLINDMEKVAAHCFHAVRDKLACRIGFFEIYGMDFMIDEQMKIWLIEINSNPAMNTNCQVLKDIIPPIISNFLEISIECFEKARRWKALLPLCGIVPLSDNPQDAPNSRKSWSVLLKSNDSENLPNQGLSGNFTIIYNESLEMAKIRQALAYDISLRLWYPPKCPTPTATDGNKSEIEKIITAAFEKSYPSPLKATPVPITTVSPIIPPMTKFKPKSPGAQHARKGTKASSRGTSSNLKKTSSGSKPSIFLNSLGKNSNCSVFRLHVYEKFILSAVVNQEIHPVPPVVLPGAGSDSLASSNVASITESSSNAIGFHENNSGNTKCDGLRSGNRELAPIAKKDMQKEEVTFNHNRKKTVLLKRMRVFFGRNHSENN